jgi:hypothetical protein
MELEVLKKQRWASGKQAVSAIKAIALQQSKHACVSKKGGTFRRLVCDSAQTGCGWFVCLSRLRSKDGAGDWHVTNANLEHQNCTGRARPSRSQLEVDSVVCAALATNPSTSSTSLVSQLQAQTGVTASKHVMYRAKEKVVSHIFSEDPTTIVRLPSFLSEFQRLNPDTFTEVSCDETGRFRCAIIIMNPQWFLHGQRVYGVDAAHMKHRKYNGVQIILVTRDSNYSNQVAAVALVPVEDFDNYNWFFSRVIQHGFPLTSCPVFSDRNLDLVSAANSLNIFNLFCIRHLIGKAVEQTSLI